jgi:hypothetical protein
MSQPETGEPSAKTMIATIHVVDLGPASAARAGMRRPALDDVPGLRWADTALLAPLAFAGPPPVRRAGLFAFWDDEDSIDRFTRDHPVGRRYSGGFHARLRPLRAHGSWPGLPPEVPASRAVPHEGPVVVLTLGRLRMSQIVRFLRTSRPAEKSAVADEKMIWGTAAQRLPFVATISIWESGKASAAYAYGRQRPQHHDAVAEQERKDFHRQSAFIRFAPIRIEGELTTKNPVSAASVQRAAEQRTTGQRTPDPAS